MSLSKRFFSAAAATGMFLSLSHAVTADEVVMTVKRGDTLQSISKEYFGTTRRWPSIFSWNKNTLKDASSIEFGMKLVIKDPQASNDSLKTSAAETKPSVQTQTANSNEVIVTVKRGETLQTISQKYFGTTRRWSDILSWNQDVLQDPSQMEVGTRLVIKNASATVAEADQTAAVKVAPAVVPVQRQVRVVAAVPAPIDEIVVKPSSSDTFASTTSDADDDAATVAPVVQPTRVQIQKQRAPASVIEDVPAQDPAAVLHSYDELE